MLENCPFCNSKLRNLGFSYFPENNVIYYTCLNYNCYVKSYSRTTVEFSQDSNINSHYSFVLKNNYNSYYMISSDSYIKTTSLFLHDENDVMHFILKINKFFPINYDDNIISQLESILQTLLKYAVFK